MSAEWALNTKKTISPSMVSGRDLGDTTYAPTITRNYSFDHGVGAEQVDQIFDDVRTLAASASENIDLNGDAANKDANGDTLALVRVKYLYIENLSATQTLTVGGAASNPWVGAFSGTFTIPPLGSEEKTAPDATGWPVVAGTGDLLKIANNAGGSADYRIIIGGGKS